MERFVVLTSTSEQTLANRTCELLEDRGIPVMLEHREILNGSERASSYRLLVPIEFVQTAKKLTYATYSTNVERENKPVSKIH